jgi:hypothetical protein
MFLKITKILGAAGFFYLLRIDESMITSTVLSSDNKLSQICSWKPTSVGDSTVSRDYLWSKASHEIIYGQKPVHGEVVNRTTNPKTYPEFNNLSYKQNHKAVAFFIELY